MKSEKISDAMGLIEDELITEAGKSRVKRRRKPLWMAGIAVAACICLLAIGILNFISPAVKTYAIAEAKYPTMMQYPDEKEFVDKATGETDYEAYSDAISKWERETDKRLFEYQVDNSKLSQFMLTSTSEFLSGAKDENRVYSPLNVYMALCMLAEVSGGNSRNEILAVLGADSMEEVRSQASNLWNSNYSDNGATTSILANSMWLNENIKFKKDTMKTLAEKYYASSYQGTMGSEDFNKKIQDWLNDQTGGLLKEQAAGIKLDPSTVMALASTIYFKGKWSSEFLKNNTKEGKFHTAKGDITCDFMHMTMMDEYYYGEGFSAVKKNFENAGNMWLILPDEGVTADELIKDGTIVNLPMKGGTNKSLTINLSMPKFDVSSDFDLKDGLKALGIKDVFDPNKSNFEPMTEEVKNIFVSKVKHAARVQVDEKGCTAAAYTVIEECGSAMSPEDEVDFVLDRPFLFVITSATNTPLFAGVVNQPVE